jgi:hypothetical protein
LANERKLQANLARTKSTLIQTVIVECSTKPTNLTCGFGTIELEIIIDASGLFVLVCLRLLPGRRISTSLESMGKTRLSIFGDVSICGATERSE